MGIVQYLQRSVNNIKVLGDAIQSRIQDGVMWLWTNCPEAVGYKTAVYNAKLTKCRVAFCQTVSLYLQNITRLS